MPCARGAGGAQDLFRILTEPETNMIAQQQLLMATEGIDLQFTDAAIDAIAGSAAEVNKTLHNIGARRLHTVRQGPARRDSGGCTSRDQTCLGNWPALPGQHQRPGLCCHLFLPPASLQDAGLWAVGGR